MIAIPMFPTDSMIEYDLFIVLDDANLERIKQYDPAEILKSGFPEGMSQGRSLRNIMIGYINKEDEERLFTLFTTGAGIHEIVRFLSRGYSVRPEDNNDQYSQFKFDNSRKN